MSKHLHRITTKVTVSSPLSRLIRLYRANCYAVQDPVPREAQGAACVSINFTSVPHPFRPSHLPSSPSLLHIRIVHSTVLQIKPACTSLIEQNFNTGSTRNSAPWVTKHRVNTMVHSGPRCKRARLIGGNRERVGGKGGKELCVWIFVEMQRHTDGFRQYPPSIERASGKLFRARLIRCWNKCNGGQNVLLLIEWCYGERHPIHTRQKLGRFLRMTESTFNCPDIVLTLIFSLF